MKAVSSVSAGQLAGSSGLGSEISWTSLEDGRDGGQLCNNSLHDRVSCLTARYTRKGSTAKPW